MTKHSRIIEELHETVDNTVAMVTVASDLSLRNYLRGITENNLASIRLHEKCGFRMVGYRERIGKDSTGTWRNTVLMEHRCAADEVGGCCSCCPK